MSLRSLKRWVRRGTMSFVSVAMVPMTLFGGMPSLQCACEPGHCGFAGASTAVCSPDQTALADRHAARGCAMAITDGSRPSPRSCCENKNSDDPPGDSHKPTGQGFGTQKSHCHVAIALHDAVQSPAAIGQDHQTSAVTLPPIESTVCEVSKWTGAAELKPGPPLDIIATLGHRLI